MSSTKDFIYTPNATTKYFKLLNKFMYVCGLPNAWIEQVKVAKIVLDFHTVLSKLLKAILVFFIVLEWGALLTQGELSEKQTSDLMVFCISHSIMYLCCLSTDCYEDLNRDILWNFTVISKKLHNDDVIEKQMLKKCKFFVGVFGFGCVTALMSYGMDAIAQILWADGTFTTVLTAWPDVNAKGIKEDIVRVIIYFVWWLFMIRASASYFCVISMMILCSHQYKNLQSYFYGLSEIFDRKNMTQEEKENIFLKSIKVGIKMHAHTIRYTKFCHTACKVIISGQIANNTIVIVLLMAQMVTSERTLNSVLPIVTTGSTLLGTTGFFMCNAGDITIEGSNLVLALYFTGWENCTKRASLQIRRLLVVSMLLANNPIVLRSFGILELSYQSYVTIVRFAYSVFSVLY